MWVSLNHIRPRCFQDDTGSAKPFLEIGDAKLTHRNSFCHGLCSGCAGGLPDMNCPSGIGGRSE